MHPKRAAILSLVVLPLVAHADGGTIVGQVAFEGHAAAGVVYIEKIKGVAAQAGQGGEMAQKDMAFTPEILVVRSGKSVVFRNQDKVFHNVFSITPGSEFDAGLYRQGESRTQDFSEPGEVDVFCNIHPAMSAKILVLQNDAFVRVTKEGRYSLGPLPPGKYSLVAWSPEHVPQKRAIEVKADGTATASFELKLRPETRPHLNKNGEQYGRYK